MKVKEVTFGIDPPPHKGTEKFPGGQYDLLVKVLSHRVTVACMGRRWGKTLAAILAMFEVGAICRGQYRVAYCTPTARLARARFEQVASGLKAAWAKAGFDPSVVKTNAQDLVIQTPGYGLCASFTAYFWGLDEPDNLRGEGLDFLIVDECKDVMRRAYFSVLRPMLIDKRGRTLLIGTPSRVGIGAAWFHEEFLRAQAGEDGYAFLHGPTFGNPVLPEDAINEEIENCRNDPKTIQEELFAQWLEDEGSVFERLKEMFSIPAKQEGVNLWLPAVEPAKPIEKWETVFIGWDMGRQNDATVMKAFRHRTREELALVRLIRTPFHEQRSWYHRLHKMFPCHVIGVGDANGLGAETMEQLSREYQQGFVPRSWADARLKEQDVSAGRELSQRAMWKHLDVKWQRVEYEAYRVVTEKRDGSALARPRYEGPPGIHDDAVAAGCMVASMLLRPFHEREFAPVVEPYSAKWHEERMDRIAQRASQGESTYSLR